MASSQRLYESACPGCGAAVGFRAAASTHAVCEYCSSTLVRDGDALQLIGKAAQVFDDYSPLQLFAQGQQGGKAFTLLGRLQYESAAGRWTSWEAQFDDGRRITLSEDNGSFVWLAQVNEVNSLPTASQMRLGSGYTLLGNAYSASAVQQTTLIAAQGEFAKSPALNTSFLEVELRSSDGKLITLSYDTDPPSVYLGKAVDLDSLQLTGLKDASTAQIKGNQFNCPNCASPVSVQLESSKAITCAGCNSIIDLSQGLGGQLKHAIQNEPIVPQIALGSIGTFEAKSWQVVGYQHRMGTPTAQSESYDDDSEEDLESFGWEEYLLYNAKAGFIFLVDSDEGWSLVRVATGAALLTDKRQAKYLGAVYGLRDTYTSVTDYVAGEFYWPVKHGDHTQHSDYLNRNNLLSREVSRHEMTWSVGSTLPHQTVMRAFGIKDDQAGEFERDASPAGFSLLAAIKWGSFCVFFLIMVFTLAKCDGGRDCQKQYNPNNPLSAQEQREQCERENRSYRIGSSGGGSWGGGGHK